MTEDRLPCGSYQRNKGELKRSVINVYMFVKLFIVNAYIAKQIYLDCGDMGNGWKLFVERAKQKGYIRKSAVEEAEEMISDYRTMASETFKEKYLNYNNFSFTKKLIEAIQELKAENERLKK